MYAAHGPLTSIEFTYIEREMHPNNKYREIDANSARQYYMERR